MHPRLLSALALALLLAPSAHAADPPGRLPTAPPAEVGLDPDRLARIDAAVKDAIDRGQCPGAVVLAVRQGKVVFRKAYGLRAKRPAEVAMTTDTVFDLASVTKPIATAASVLCLIEDGKVQLGDPVSRYLPDFKANGKDRVTVEQLLTHTSGLLADNALADYADGRAKAIERINALPLQAEPGAKFVYSDVGFIVLGELVERVASEPLDTFAAKRLFRPLGMRDTTFKPPADLTARAAPTEQRDGHWMRGEVHDPRSYRFGGVAGHAGLFSTADDLAVFAQMLLDNGAYAGRRVLSPAAVRLMTAPRPVPGGRRTLGWDARTRYSSNRGELFGEDSFGHTGFTGTSIWIDPGSRTAVIFLSNRVHPDGKGNVTRVRGQVATLVASSIVKPPFPNAPKGTRGLTFPARPVLTGIDVLKRDGFKSLRGRRVGLVTNHTGRDRDGTATIDLLHRAEGVKLVALFSPEHGIRGQLDRPVADAKDAKTGLPVYSLYGKTRKPTAEQLKGIDTLVYDIQDIGCRFYTYISTLGLLLEAAAEHKLKVVVLDRPNPIGGVAVEGPVLDRKLESFVGYHPLPVRHGMTVGELAGLFNVERKTNADLEVVKVEGWRREDTFDRTGLTWIDPSPNMRGLTAALLYPGVGLLETTNVSVGRGTDRPFEIVGAPWIDGRKLAEALTAAGLPGLRLVPRRFTPTASTFAGQECDGVQLIVDDWRRFGPLDAGLTLACQLQRLYPKDWQAARYQRLLGHPPTLEAIRRGDTPEQIRRLWRRDLTDFLAVRAKYLLY